MYPSLDLQILLFEKKKYQKLTRNNLIFLSFSNRETINVKIIK